MKNVMNVWIHLICLMDDRKKELTDAVDCPEHNELFGLNRVNPNQQLMHLMDKIYKKINLEDFGDASLI